MTWLSVTSVAWLSCLRDIGTRLGVANTNKTRVFIMGYPGVGKPGMLGALNAERNYRTMEVHMNTVAGNEIMVLESSWRSPSMASKSTNRISYLVAVNLVVAVRLHPNYLIKNKNNCVESMGLFNI